MMQRKKTMLVLRRLTQAAVFVLFVYIIWMTRYPLSGFINPAVFFKLDPLVMLVTSVAERVVLPGLLFAGVTLAVTAVFGRAFCGWVCPLGTVMDWWAALVGPLIRKKEKEPGKARKTKYFILAAIGLLSLFGIQFVWLFDPITVFVRTFSFNIHPFVNGTLDKLFEVTLKLTNFYPPIESLYYAAKDSFLEVANPRFPHSFAVLVVFGGILGLVFVKRRFWCRYLCPLGALLAVTAKVAPFMRTTPVCVSGCSACRNLCRTNAIGPDNSCRKEECILCMECAASCPSKGTSFGFKRRATEKRTSPGDRGMSRSQFLLWAGGALALASGKARAEGETYAARPVLRPPAALDEKEFVQRCVRCGNCMKVCLTNGLQPAGLESGFSGIWTPRLNTAIGYCEYNCTLCGNVCPTGAIKRLTQEEKNATRLGIATVHKERCIAWAKGEDCILCEEQCPVATKAIKTIERKNAAGKTIKLPYVDTEICVGCGLCEFKCPLNGKKGISVTPL